MFLSRRKAVIAVTLLLVAYLGGYVACRIDGSIVHRTGYRTESGLRVLANHWVSTGGGVAEVPRSPLPALVFAPLRWIEQAGWYLAQPTGSSWIDEQ